MTDAAITFVLEKLTDLLVSTAKQIASVREEVESVKNDMEFFKGFLREVSKKPIKDEALKALVKQIRSTVFEAEDILDEYVLEVVKYKSRNTVGRITHPLDHPAKLLDLARKIQPIRAIVKEIQQKMQLQDGKGPNGSIDSKQAPIVEEDHVVGFQEETEAYIKFLTEGPLELQVTSIVGMPGLGKTTLANLIFRHLTIEYEFYNRVWVYVSKDCNRKEVFLSILSQIGQDNDKLRNMTEESLVTKLRQTLENEKYLVFVDDVWTVQNWNSIQIAFPRNNKKSRILVTTRFADVAKHANSSKEEPKNLRFLTPDESWTLLQRKALGPETCPQNLVAHGKQIANKCEGLPLAIVVIGGILLEKGTNPDDWQDVSKNVKDYYIGQDRQETVENLIAWSFYELPYELKACFIYFGILPKEYNITVRKLIRLWIAEGFIQRRGEMNPEKVSEEYLDALVKRNLVMVKSWRSNGKMKTCHVHDVIHVFCKSIARDENSYVEIKRFEDIPTSSTDDAFKMCRGLSIPPPFVNKISPKLFGSHVRSFLCLSSSNEEIEPLLTDISAIPKTFRLLRVLDGEPIRFTRFPPDLGQLVNLRYLVLCIKFKTIPKHIAGLWNMQTLIVKTSLTILEIKGDISKMSRLRYLETNASTSLSLTPAKKGSSEDETLRDLRTLSSVSPESCTEDIAERAPNLNKLGIRGQLGKLFDENGGRLFDNVKKLNYLENLKLVHEALNVSDSRVIRLPDRLPPNLRKLTLTGTQLRWEDMSTIGRLERLKILKLKENAFKGDMWVARDGGFPVLEVLVIGRTDLATWEAYAHQFPNLKILRLQHCTSLSAVPSDLANISCLQIMELYWTTREAAASARNQKKKLVGQTDKGKGFKLSIYPPEHDTNE